MSGHAICLVAVWSLEDKVPSFQPIPKWIAKTHEFVAYHDNLVRQTKLHLLEGVSRVNTHRAIIKEAAMLARDDLSVARELSVEGGRYRLLSLARVVAFQQVKKAEIIIRFSPIAKEHLKIESGLVEIVKEPL